MGVGRRRRRWQAPALAHLQLINLGRVVVLDAVCRRSGGGGHRTVGALETTLHGRFDCGKRLLFPPAGAVNCLYN